VLGAVCAAAVGLAALTGCAGPSLEDYAAQRPQFDLQTYFNGDVTAHGMFSDRSGKVLRRFVVTMHCDWTGDQGTLDERFAYDDGEKQQRIWHVTKLADGRYVGKADDVVGEALGGQAGSAFNWHYTLKLPVQGSVYEVQFDDWMYQIDSKTVLNKAVMSKLGFRVGDITLSFSKP
jgi:hypothetical protein